MLLIEPVEATVLYNNPTGYSQVVEETNGNGILERSYHIGHQRFAMSYHVNGGDISYYSFDGHGSIRGLTNATGELIEEYDFDSYGILIGFRKDEGAGLVDQDPSLIGGLSRNEFLFAGEQWDADMGMYYNRARYYDVENGRFNAMDDWEGDFQTPLTLNKYLYGGANPTSYIDPSGNNYTMSSVMSGVSIGINLSGMSATTLTSIGLVAASTIDLIYNDGQGLRWLGEGMQAGHEYFARLAKNAREIAREARRAMRRVRDNIRRNFRIPVFVVFKSIMPNIYEFNRDAIIANPSWAVLNYNGKGSPLTPRNRAIVKRTWGHLRVSAPAGYQLDEFPFASTAQGGAGALGKMVPGIENSVQGGELGGTVGLLDKFYGTALKNAPLPFMVLPINL